jgi:hypothetical protein
MDFPTSVKGLPFLPMEFDKSSYRVDASQASDLLSYIQTNDVTDLLVLSHGWNNDEADAFRLYKNLLSSISKEADADFNARKVAVLGVFWPSKKFADSDLIPGGAASFDDDLPADVLVAEIEAMRGFFDTDDAEDVLDRLVELVPDLSSKKSARTEFGEKVRGLLGNAADDDDELADEIPDTFFDMEGDQILEELAVPRDEEGAPGSDGSGDEGGIAAVGAGAAGVATGDPTGGVAGLGGFFRGIRSGAGSALNMVTYWKMKSRAGQVGRSGLAPLLAEIRAKAPALRIHLVGHSFGGRLVAAAALGKDDADPVLPISSMTLLQAAFSHNGFAENWRGNKDGYFRDVYADARVAGPTLVTYTANDRANRLAYPLASRLARQTAAARGGADDVYGAIGANGAQNTPEAVAGTLVSRRESYAFENGKLYNLEASYYVANHFDVAGREIANAIVAAIGTPDPAS